MMIFLAIAISIISTTALLFTYSKMSQNQIVARMDKHHKRNNLGMVKFYSHIVTQQFEKIREAYNNKDDIAELINKFESEHQEVVKAMEKDVKL